jgi:hypothetical protein
MSCRALEALTVISKMSNTSPARVMKITYWEEEIEKVLN